jgi:hypothetical protein
MITYFFYVRDTNANTWRDSGGVRCALVVQTGARVRITDASCDVHVSDRL